MECALHQGYHIRESELLGEIVLTTLGREAMPLIRYRTGDLARLDRRRCGCGGRTARLYDIRGRMSGCTIGDSTLHSRQLDDMLFAIPGLLDYRAVISGVEGHYLHIDYLAEIEGGKIAETIRGQLRRQPVIRKALAGGSISIGDIRQVEIFAASHTVKRTIHDRRR